MRADGAATLTPCGGVECQDGADRQHRDGPGLCELCNHLGYPLWGRLNGMKRQQAENEGPILTRITETLASVALTTLSSLDLNLRWQVPQVYAWPPFLIARDGFSSEAVRSFQINLFGPRGCRNRRHEQDSQWRGK